MPDNDIDFDVEIGNEREGTTYPLRVHWHAANESLIINNENLLELALGEDREARHISFDKKCQE